jgi:GTPase SAR1 family protein
MTELDALKAIDFDWTMHLQSVWCDRPYDVAEFQEELRRALSEKLDELNRGASPLSPLGWPLLGAGGVGKTHLLSVLRRQAIDRKIAFVLVDMTDVHDFWQTVLLGYLSSLQQACEEGRFQYETILMRFIDTLNPREPVGEILRKLRQAKTQFLADASKKVLAALGRKYPLPTRQHQDVIRALIALNSDDFEVSSAGLTWLQGHTIDAESQAALGFTVASRRAPEIVEALSWLMSLAGPTVVALDQLDPIVTHLNIASGHPDSDQAVDEIRVARSIIEGIAAGLGALRDKTNRTLIVISCLETTWTKLSEQVALKTTLDRYESPRPLKAINHREIAERILLSRLCPAYQRIGFQPKYPTWPFAPEVFADMQGLSPRQLLKFGYEHVRRCVGKDRAEEMRGIRPSDGQGEPPASPGRYDALDARFQQYRREAAPAELLDEKMDDDRMAPLLQTACRCLIRELNLPHDVEGVVDTEFHGGQTTRPLHARLRVIHHREGEREEHFCLRSLERAHARAFQARLNAAITLSGIDRRLGFRRLAIVRAAPVPSGAVTEGLVDKFRQSGGVLVSPTEDELRTLWSLAALEREKDADFVEWLRARRPASSLALMKAAVGGLCPNGSTAGEVKQEVAGTPPEEKAGPAAVPPISPSGQVPLGWQWIGDRPVELVQMPVGALEKHTVILAGAGSGKTVLLRRLVEEVALLGIPSIVIDCANDLATLGDRWPAVPESWHEEDVRKAEAYFQRSEVLVWTPGRESGNPLCLEALPDLAAVADNDDELNAAVEMVKESLQKIVAPGAAASAAMKLAVLSAALRYFAKHGGGALSEFVPFLRDLPADARLSVGDASKLARAMADRLTAEIETNVLLRDTGAALDPTILLGDHRARAKTRISVINLVGLVGLEAQRQFLNQLAMTLFSWLKKHPTPPGRALRGLLVIDEAKDFVPSQGSTTCKASLMRLAAQARKYHLGVVFATQNPKEIENNIISNCSTQYFGKAGSPEAIKVVRDQIQFRGGCGDDVPALPRGTFYVYNADAKLSSPVKVRIPMCLSHHRANPLEEQEILRRAARSRQIV